MSKIGRNAPCPCGSGKKYKKCCLRDEQRRESDARHRAQGIELVLDWLIEHHHESALAALRADFFKPWDLDLLDDEEILPSGILDLMWNNAWEWLIAEGRLGIDESGPWALDAILASDGPSLDSDQRAWIEAMAQHPLGLYEVEEVGAMGAVKLLDLDDPDRPPFEVHDHAVAEVVRRGEVFGARIIPVGGRREASPAHYPFSSDLVSDLENQLDMLSEVDDLSPEERAFRVDRIIVDNWVGELAEIFLGPDLVDGDGAADAEDDRLWILDRYRVDNWDALEAAFAADEDFEGNRQIGWVVELEDGEHVAFNPSGEEEIVVFAELEDVAETGREWFEKLAGKIVERLERRIEDPLKRPHPEPPAGLSGEELTAWTQGQLEEHFHDWLDRPLPILDGKTPRLALRDPERRRLTVGILHRYETNENEWAEEEERPAATFDFLWSAAGLEREAELELFLGATRAR